MSSEAIQGVSIGIEGMSLWKVVQFVTPVRKCVLFLTPTCGTLFVLVAALAVEQAAAYAVE